MSKPRYGWWAYAKYMIRVYPEHKKELSQLHGQSVTQGYSQISKTTGTNRSTENTALRTLPRAKQAEYDAVSQAIQKTMLLRTGQERLKLIDMVFWKQSHNLEGSGYELGYSDRTARRFHRDFIFLVGLYRGLADVEDSA